MDLAKKFSPASASEQTGISEDRIINTARELVSRKPSLVAFGGNPGAGPFSIDEQIIFMDLNILLGSVGGEIVAQTKLPEPFNKKVDLANETHLADVPDHSINVLIMDGEESGNTTPWRLIQRKLVPNNPTVVSLSPYFTGVARYADFLIPSPTFLESYGDSPTPLGASVASYAVSVPVLVPPKTAVEPLDIIRRIATATHSKFEREIQSFEMTTLLRYRVGKIFNEKEGSVFDASTGKTTKLTSISSPESLMRILSNGGCWYSNVDSRPHQHRYSFLGGEDHGFERLAASANSNSGKTELVLLPYATSKGQPHQLMTKLYRESDLREPANLASINPETGKKMNLIDDNNAVVKTESGISKVKVNFDKAIMPGVIQVAIGLPTGNFNSADLHDENILEICKIENDSTWRITKAEIFPA